MRTCARFPRRRWQLALAAGVVGVGLAGAAQAQAQSPARAPTSTLRLVSETPYAAQGAAVQAPAMTAEQLRDTAIDAYVYAYPMVLMEMTRRASTNVQTPIAGRAPMNQFGHRTAFPDPRATDVAWPSTDTLSSSLWYDVSREPLIVQVPAAGARYYLLSLLDMWTDAYASRGTRTTGGGAQTFAIVGPYWQGTLPLGVDMVRSPTGSGWMIARVQTGGPDDYQNVNQFQAALTVTPLAQWGKPFRMTGSAAVNPAWSAGQSPAEQVAAMDAASYFNLFADLLRSNPPHANDYPMLDRLRRLGLGDQPNAYARLSPTVQQALIEAQPLAGRRIADAAGRLGTPANGWNTALHGIGTYGTDYLRRAAVAYVGLGANPPEDVLYPVTAVDARGKALRSDEDYVLHFDKDQLPPANAFWSLILYDARQGLADNPIDRYALRSTDPLVYNADGSLDIYIQRDPPRKARQANWLPAPRQGDFMLNLRLYWPRDIALDGNWAPPAVRED
ncbi:DUF1254 domain-containing protein [Bordetella parapertussis]|uniref:Exported protein n=2 Tax=Bordetella parapertussis TaxID=519 RepID=Q7W3A3_BORPA|nr:DUF1254 domain-containing protein [Bordetella parapertussis]AOB41026.1 hypothetical protein BBB43_20910 [Bordetella parapertussis]AUL45065.1 hypothetical protein BTL54_21035 [Bordetella parapertussis]AWP64967.1 hypothetical protein B7P06_21045 [Bordetella parapertussis]AWP72475.1 hypothetical protein B7O99_21035 [Bordetella parapertussis]AWP91076.1 hypothetical protein B7P05_21040 [Bordetella parapertussis]